MERQDWLMFMGTFLFGAVTGIYLYFVGFEPTFQSSNRTSDLAAVGFRITAEERGACQEQPSGCGSWRVEGNRSYRFIRTDARGDIFENREGLISRNLFNPLEEELTLWFQGRSAAQYDSTPPSCPADTRWYRYRVEVRERPVFHLASCDTSLRDDPILKALSDITATFPQ